MCRMFSRFTTMTGRIAPRIRGVPKANCIPERNIAIEATFGSIYTPLAVLPAFIDLCGHTPSVNLSTNTLILTYDLTGSVVPQYRFSIKVPVKEFPLKRQSSRHKLTIDIRKPLKRLPGKFKSTEGLSVRDILKLNFLNRLLRYPEISPA